MVNFCLDGMNKIIRAFKSLKRYEVLICLIMFAISVYYAILPQDGTPQWLAIINFIFCSFNIGWRYMDEFRR